MQNKVVLAIIFVVSVKAIGRVNGDSGSVTALLVYDDIVNLPISARVGTFFQWPGDGFAVVQPIFVYTLNLYFHTLLNEGNKIIFVEGITGNFDNKSILAFVLKLPTIFRVIF